ncbi:transporter substrate-binding domain-containing protein [Rhodococcus sovatensis]|uniref:Transporter substrate-binding domain-containing protein n=1 Tax=Rhodococcus sovatensis TaxID=1805840 RepID=A0ABZ2PHX9_9NOCA
MNWIKCVAGVATAVSLSVALTSCGTSTSDEPAAAEGALPSPYNAGLVVPYINYAPYSYLDEAGTMIGIDPDVAAGISSELGIPLEGANAAFEQTLLGVQQGKFAWAPAADITRERLQTFDFVSYLKDSYTFMTKVDSPDVADDTLELCGLRIGINSGSSATADLEGFSKACEDAGEQAIDIQAFPDQTANQLALSSERIDLVTASLTNIAYQQSLTDEFKTTGPSYAEILSGLTVKKDSGMAQPLADALNAMIADGSYDTIFAKYNLEDAEVEKSEVNPDPGR